MSLSLAQTWVDAFIRWPAVRADAIRIVERAAGKGVDATLIVGSELSTNGRCYLARWDGRELTAIELSGAQQKDWGLNPDSLFRQLEPISQLAPTASTERLVTLSSPEFEQGPPRDGRAPLTGLCTAEKDPPSYLVISNCALLATFFRPDLKRPMTAMWYANKDLFREKVVCQFRFPPIFSDKNPQSWPGSVVVFLQLYTAENWATKAGCRRISNVAHGAVTLR